MATKSQNAPSAATKSLELSDELKKLGFSKVLVPINGLTKNLIIIHNDRPIIAMLDFNNWSNTDKSVKTALSSNNIDNEISGKFMVFLSHEYVRMMEQAVAADTSKEKEDNEKIQYMQKYSDATRLAEAVLIAGIPMFVVSDRQEYNTNITFTDSIDLEYKIIKPLKEFTYLNRPYSFVSSDQINKYIERARHETLASLYSKVKEICRKYIEEDDNHRNLLAADIVFTHFQDILGITHYLFFVGGPDSGKSSNLTVMEVLAYRNFMNTDVTSANVYRFLGQYEHGQGTLSFDEANTIAESKPLMSIFNSGYTTGKKVARIDVDNNGDQNGYHTYCFKAFAAEELSDSDNARAFNTRCIPLKCTPGVPEFDITEVLNPAGDEENQKALFELMDLRNLLLAFRLLHFQDHFPNINNLSLKGREKQLFKSLLRLFQGTEVSEEIKEVVAYYVSKRREVNKSTLNAFVYRCIRQIIKEQTKEQHGSENANVIESDIIWKYVKGNLAGNEILSRPQSFQSIDYGEISQKQIIQILKEVFGATPSKRHGQGRKLVFDLNKLDRFESLYGLEKADNGDDNSRTNNSFLGLEENKDESAKSNGTDGTHEMDSRKVLGTIEEHRSSQDVEGGTYGTLSDEKPCPIEESTTQKNADSESTNENNSEEPSLNSEDSTSENDQKSHEYSKNVSQASHLVERGDSAMVGAPTDQNLQDKVPLPKQTRFSTDSYDSRSSSIIPFRRSTEGIAPVKEVIIEGIAPIRCIFCNNFRTSIELDLRIHLSDNQTDILAMLLDLLFAPQVVFHLLRIDQMFLTCRPLLFLPILRNVL